jgi:hypothetical protein
MWTPWHAVDEVLNRAVVVSFLRADLAQDEQSRATVRTAARTAGSGVGHVFDYGEGQDVDGTPVVYVVADSPQAWPPGDDCSVPARPARHRRAVSAKPSDLTE